MNKPITTVIWRLSMKALGVTLVCSFIVLVGMIMYSYLYDVCKLHFFVTKSYVLTTFLLLFGIFIGFNICFNYLMCVFTGPGGTDHLKSLMPPSRELEGIVVVKDENTFVDSDEEDLETNPFPYKGKKCTKCNNFKPLRAHHCSLCDTCVLRMDHHCPWVNNCIGHYNHRYFLLMILYVLLGTGFFVIFSLPLYFGSEYQQLWGKRTSVFTLVFYISLALFVVMIPFNAWNWYLATTGQTTIEFWMRGAQEDNSRKQELQEANSSYLDFRQPSKVKNLEYIFGTVNVFRIFLPSIRSLRHDGINWETYIR